MTAIRDLLTGRPSYKAQTPWRPFPALLVTVAIVVAAITAASAAVAALHLWPRFSAASGAGDHIWSAALWLLTFQAALIGLVFAAVAMRHARPAAALALEQRPPVRLVIAGVAVMAILMLPYNLIVLTLAREQVLEDLRSFTAPLHSEAAGLFALIIAIGAPLSEELLFRGFLLGALSQSRLGFTGAALVSNVAWTALHAGYSALGLAEVFAAGLIFSWLLWRTGNLWVPIICHGIYNTLMLALVWLLPLNG